MLVALLRNAQKGLRVNALINGKMKEGIVDFNPIPPNS